MSALPVAASAHGRAEQDQPWTTDSRATRRPGRPFPSGRPGGAVPRARDTGARRGPTPRELASRSVPPADHSFPLIVEGAALGRLTLPLVGRDDALAQLEAAQSATADGWGGCVVVEGPAGIGKTRLLAEATEAARREGISVAAASATELDRLTPLGSFLRALRSGSPPVLDDEAMAQLAEREEAGFWLLNRVGEAIEAHAERRPMVVILDDAQWSDELTALALRTIVPDSASSPVLWLFARRPQTSKSPARDSIDWLLATGASLLQLGPLPVDAIAEFTAAVLGAVPDATLLTLAERSGGNPFLLEQLLKAHLAEGRVVVDKGTARVVGDGLPSTFLSAASFRLRDLHPPARRLLDAGAVIGRPFTVHEIAGIAGMGPGEALGAADEAGAAGILVPAGSLLTFDHDILREAVYETMTGAARQVLHTEAVRVLRAGGRPAVEIAQHVIRAAPVGGIEVLDLVREASETIARQAPGMAADLLVEALGLVDEAGPGRAALEADAVRYLAAAARLSEARQLGEAALARGLAPDIEASILLGLAEALKHAGQDSAVVEMTGRALSRPSLSGVHRAELLAIRAHALIYVNDPDEAARAANGAVDAGQAAGWAGPVVFAMAARSVVALSRGDLDGAVDMAREAVRRADEAGDEARQRHPALWLGRALVASDHFTEANALFDLAGREADRFGTAWAKPLSHCYRAELRLASGDLADAQAEAEAGLSVTERLSAHALSVALLGRLAEIAVYRNDLAVATARVDHARRLVAEGAGATPEDIDWAGSLVKEAAGDISGAFADLAWLYDALPDRLLLLASNPRAAARMVSLALACRRGEQAEAVADAAARFARRNPDHATLAGAAAHAEGVLSGDPDVLRAAVDAYRHSPRRLAAAAALEAAAAMGRPPRTAAVELLEEALAIYAASGARRDHARVLNALRALGVRRRRSVPATFKKAGWDSLTEAELRVVRLVAQGLTNRAVADRLFLSTHTVDTHIRHAFTKLGVSSRVALTRHVLAQDGSGG